MTNRTRGQADDDMLSDGKALDLATDQAERWARTFRADRSDSPSQAAHDALDERARELADRTVPPVRAFTGRDWVLGVVLWLCIGAIVFVGSVALLGLSGQTTIWFALFALGLAVVGLWQSYAETTSVPRHERKVARKREWLVGATHKAAMKALERKEL